MTDLPSRFVPGSTGLPILAENQISGMVHEVVVHWRLVGAGYAVTNLNVDIMDRFPVADLVARNGRHRLLVQVRGAAADSGAFRVNAAEVERLDQLASVLGHRGIYAFVYGQVKVEFCATTDMLRRAASDEYLDSGPFLIGAALTQRLDQMLDGKGSRRAARRARYRQATAARPPRDSRTGG